MIHVAFGRSAQDCLTKVLREHGRDDTVIGLDDDLSIGPIGCDAPARAAALRKEFGWPPAECLAVKESSRNFWSLVTETEEPMTVWVAPTNAPELAGFLAFADRVRTDRFEIIAPDWTRPFSRGGRGSLMPIATCLLAPEDIMWWLEKAPRATRGSDIRIRGDWAELERSPTWLRIIKEHRLVAAPDDYFDEFLLHFCTFWGESTRHTVASAMGAVGQTGHFVSDGFFYWRLKKMAEKGMVECNRFPGKPMQSKGVYVRNVIGPYLSFRSPRSD